MKLVLAHNTMATIGGAQIVTNILLKHLSKLGHEIHFITNKINEEFKYASTNIHIYKLTNLSTDNMAYWLSIPLMKKKIRSIIENVKPDLIIATNFPMNYLSLDPYICNIYYCHEPFPFFYFKRYIKNLKRIKKIAVKILTIFFKKKDIMGGLQSDLIIANSHFTKKMVNKIYKKNDVRVLYPPLSLCSPEKKSLRKYDDIINRYDKLNRLLIVSPSSSIKGFDKIPEIFKYVYKKSKKENFLIFVTGKIDEGYTKDIETLNNLKNSKVITTGFIKREELIWLYRNFGYTLYLSEKEPFGLVPIEAFMNNSMPIILDDNSGPSETIKHRINGFIVEKNTYKKNISQILIKKSKTEIYGKKTIDPEEYGINLPHKFTKKLLNFFDDYQV